MASLTKHFAFTGERETVDKARAEELLDPLREKSGVTSIKLSGKSLSLEAARVVAEVLDKLESKLEVVDFSDILASQDTDEARETLAVLSGALLSHADTIRSLNVSDNALGPAGVRALQPILAATRLHIHDLFFNNDGMAVAACEELASILCTGHTVADANGETATLQLRTLHLFNNLAENGGAKAIGTLLKQCPHLQDLRIASTRIQTEGGAALSEALAAATNLRSVEFSDNTFDDVFCANLAPVLEKQEHLHTLNLCSTGISTEGASTLFRALAKANCPLKVLDVSGNDLEADCAEDLAAVLNSKMLLEELNVEENELGDGGVESILSALLERDASVLKRINLRLNELGDGIMQSVHKVLEHEATLENINLNANSFSALSIVKLTEKATELDRASVLDEFDENETEDPEEELEKAMDNLALGQE